MVVNFLLAVVGGLASVLIGSLFFEAMLIPRPPVRGRPVAAWAVHGGLCLLIYALELVLFQRVFFGALMALSSLLLLVVVSNVKTAMLREPFLFQDFEYFTDLLRHPRLYLPFFGVWKALVGLGVFIVSVCAGMALEPSLLDRNGWELYLGGLALLASAGGCLLRFALDRPVPVLSFEPAADLEALGFLGFLWWYGLAERKPILQTGNHPFIQAMAGNFLAARPNFVVVQSESFFDPRRLYCGISAEVMSVFDQVRQASWQQGLLTVPAWGANTVRTEFAFLSGLGPQALGVHRFNPYRKLAGQNIPTLASHLKSLGYRTVCVHPYWSSFYRRDRVYPEMGFDEFISIAEFSETDRCGPYIGDVAVGRVVRQLLENTVEPLFVFVITMENHGPLHWESVDSSDESRLYRVPPPKGFDDLTVYLRHLENAGRMLADVQAALQESDHDGWLCWYGDHVPIMPEVYAATGFSDGRTDYFIWRSAGFGSGLEEQGSKDIRVEDLAELLRSALGVT